MAVQQIIAQEYFVRSSANIFGTSYQVLNNFHIGGVGNHTFDTNSKNPVTWWNFTVDVLGELFVRAADAPLPGASKALEAQTKAQGAAPTSILKVELEYPQGNAKKRIVRFDIGAGVNIFVPPTWKLQARILGPVAEENDLSPPGFDRALQVATSLVVTGRCVEAPLTESAAKWTQPFFLPTNATIDVGVVEGARAAFVTTNVPVSPTGLETLLVRRTVDGTAVDTTAVGTTNARGAPPDTFTETKTIPGPANTLRYRSVVGPSVGSIIQLLQM